MKFLWLFIVSLVTAYDIGKVLQEFPKCALDCVTAGSQQVGCGVLDLTCECSKFEQLTKIVTPCLVHAGCKLDEITQSASVVVKLCEAEYAKLHNTSDPHIGKVNDDPKKAAAMKVSGGASLAMAMVAVGMLFML